VGLAHALGVIAVAEGVETADQQEILGELGCDLVQGYYLSKPLSREAMEKLLARTLNDSGEVLDEAVVGDASDAGSEEENANGGVE
jgi:predicted signal transduction protein with EAL and GGDEF domain